MKNVNLKIIREYERLFCFKTFKLQTFRPQKVFKNNVVLPKQKIALLRIIEKNLR